MDIKGPPGPPRKWKAGQKVKAGSQWGTIGEDPKPAPGGDVVFPIDFPKGNRIGMRIKAEGDPK